MSDINAPGHDVSGETNGPVEWDERGPCNGPRDCVGTERGCAVCDPRPLHDCGHVCCDDRSNPHHDHWLSPDECPTCEARPPLTAPWEGKGRCTEQTGCRYYGGPGVPCPESPCEPPLNAPNRPKSVDLTPGTRLRLIDGQRGIDGKGTVVLDRRKDPAEHVDDFPWNPGWWLTEDQGGLADFVIDDENSRWEILP
jgi:hypothetical protein